MGSKRAARRKHSASAPLALGEGSLDSLVRRARRAAFAGDAASAIPLYVEAISKGCAQPSAFNDLGTLLAQRGQIPAAVIQFEIAVSLEPAALDVRKNLCRALDSMGLTAFREGRWAEAATAFARLSVIDESSVVALTNAGMSWLKLNAPERALPYLRQAAALSRHSAVAHYNLGSVLFQLNETSCAAELLRAIELDPGHVDAHVNLALVHNRLGQLTQAAAYLAEALRLAPDNADAHANLAAVLREQGEIDASFEHYRRALDLRPQSSRIFSNYLLARQGDPDATPSDLLADHLMWNARFAAPIDPGGARVLARSIDRDPDRRLKIGYVSPDFRNHSVATFIEPVLAAHDRTQVHVTCYSDSIPDAVTERIQSQTRPDVWRDVRLLGDEPLAKRIADDGIDVLIDLSGHTADNRLLTFARRPAPVQVTYCGYPGTTGLAAMGWRLTDAVADPEDAPARHHSEQLWRLPNGFLCFQANPAFGPPAASPHLSRGFITFGSFNNLSKVGEGVLDVWAQILGAVPRSRLLLKSRALSDEGPRVRLRHALQRRAIDPDRVEFVRYAASPEEHAACYGQVDIALDPFPYSGTTTTCEALWMGVPVLTVAGATHAARVSASILHRIGCAELVTATRDAYVESAVRLAHAPDRLASYRAELRGHMQASPLMNSALLTRDLEDAYRAMWRLWCVSTLPGTTP